VEYSDLNDIFGEGGFSDFFTQIFGGMGGTRTQIAPDSPACSST
jgi:hypothetical protein